MEMRAEIHNTQLKTMEGRPKRSEKMMLKSELQQRKLKEGSKRGDHEFVLRMAEQLKK